MNGLQEWSYFWMICLLTSQQLWHAGTHVGAGKVNIKTASDSRLVTNRHTCNLCCHAHDLISCTKLLALLVVPGPFSRCHLVAGDFTAFKNSSAACHSATYRHADYFPCKAKHALSRARFHAVFEDLDEVSKCQGSPSKKQKPNAPAGHP